MGACSNAHIRPLKSQTPSPLDPALGSIARPLLHRSYCTRTMCLPCSLRDFFQQLLEALVELTRRVPKFPTSETALVHQLKGSCHRCSLDDIDCCAPSFAVFFNNNGCPAAHGRSGSYCLSVEVFEKTVGNKVRALPNWMMHVDSSLAEVGKMAACCLSRLSSSSSNAGASDRGACLSRRVQRVAH